MYSFRCARVPPADPGRGRYTSTDSSAGQTRCDHARSLGTAPGTRPRLAAKDPRRERERRRIVLVRYGPPVVAANAHAVRGERTPIPAARRAIAAVLFTSPSL